jgi:DNA-binding transcriptional LysR family regulator
MILDLTSLQTLVAAIDLKGFGKAAERLHRSPAAVSVQLKALEARVGTALFRKTGRQRVLTEAGEMLLIYARRLLQLNDEALIALRGMDLNGEVRFGMTQDFADYGLPHTLARFSYANSAVRMEIKIDCSTALRAQLAAGALDLILAFGETASAGSSPLARLPVRWFAHPGLALQRAQPVPLLLLEQPCVFRETAIAALDKAKRPWRLVLSSRSVSAIWAAADAGLGITARSTLHVPSALVDVGRTFGLPKLGKIALCVEQDQRRSNPAAEHLRALVEDIVRAHL